ncbi:ATP-dependent DNA ligase [Labedella phragmitis]|uniref:ATP-dependent DNA ligase n=1 Tax=Labedella phragmitis TaxID=2498849 RepID=A0A444PUE6_9MICO|nr:ATP-dependent DNA ligase [Labedella phragmitis]RWZ51482.1 ATP-dependent DNA ligase [Labedella phragmitis]
MGSVIYNDSVLYVDDATLAHLQYAIVQRYRRGESFLLTWTDDGSVDGRERSLWLSPNAPLSFEFDAPGDVPLELVWVDALNKTADATGGLRIVDRDGEPVAVTTR